MESRMIAWRLCCESYEDETADSVIVGDHKFIIRQMGNKLWICFRGTANFKNFMEDVSVWPTKTRKGYRVHRGFNKAFLEIWPTVLITICQFPEDMDIVFTGHSLGGAIAVRAGEELTDKRKVQLITFGCPKVYLRFFKAPILDHTRIVRDDDLVTKIPGIFYKHVQPPLIIYDKDLSLPGFKDHPIKGYNPERL